MRANYLIYNSYSSILKENTIIGFKTQYGYQKLEIRVFWCRIFFTFFVLIRIISEQKMDQLSVKKRSFNKNHTYIICVGRIWIVCNKIFLIQKYTFNGLLTVIGIQKE